MSDLVPTLAEMVERFNRSIIDLPIPNKPERLSEARKDFGVELLDEELTEFIDANTLEDETDALIDLTYIALGRLVEMGVAVRPVFEEVHAANMRKERGTKSTRPTSLGCDAVKPGGWIGPDLAPYLEATRDQLLSSLMKPAPKILVLGYARHGKDTVCEMLRDDHGFKFQSSSMFLAEKVVLPVLGPRYGYTCWEDCWEDREGHRTEWYQLLREYNTPDNTRLARGILETNDVYCGLRSAEEFRACEDAGLFDFVVWVDRLGFPPESVASCTVRPDMADILIANNGSLDDLRDAVTTVVGRIEEKTGESK